MSLSSNSPKQLGTFFQSEWPTPLVCSLHTRLCTISKIFMKIWISIFHHIHWLQLHLGWHPQSHPLVPFPNYFSQLFPSLEQGTCRWSWTDKVSLHSKSDTEADPKALLASLPASCSCHPREELLCHLCTCSRKVDFHNLHLMIFTCILRRPTKALLLHPSLSSQSM